MYTFLIGIGVYFLLMALIGYWAGRRVKTMEDYLVAGRRLPFYLAVPTIVATWFGAGSCMGVSGTVYGHGFYGVLADPFGCSLALVIAGLFFAAPFRRMRLLTVSDLFRKYYGPRFELVATVMVIPFYLGTLAAQMLAMGYVFHIISGVTPAIGILVGSLVIVFYTVAGGIWAVTITDFIQFGLLVVGLFLIVPVCLGQVSDPGAVWNTFLGEFSKIAPHNQSGSNFIPYVGRILLTGLGAILGQDLLQRSMASRTESVARWSAVTGALFYLALGLIPLFIGIAGRSIYPNLEQPELLIPLLAKEFLSPLTFTIFACGLFAAIMSTADSYLLAGGSLVTHNIILRRWPDCTEKVKVRLLRSVNIAIALLALLLAFRGTSIFDLMVHSGAALFVALFVPASAALFWKGANTSAAWGGLIGGSSGWIAYIISHIAELSTSHEEVLFSAAAVGALVSLVAYFGVSYLRNKIPFTRMATSH